jgi:surfactin synthase thioesterase subunit
MSDLAIVIVTFGACYGAVLAYAVRLHLRRRRLGG